MINDDLPAPLSPMTPSTSPGIQLEVGSAERDHPPEALDEPAREQDRLSLVGCDARRLGAHTPTLRIHWSMATAIRISAPIAKFW